MESRSLLSKAPYLEAQDDGPDEAEGQPVVPIHNVMGTHVLKMDSLLLQELKSLVYILQTVDAHPSLRGFRLEPENRGGESSASEQRRLQRITLNPMCLAPKPKLKFVCTHLVQFHQVSATAAIHTDIGEDHLNVLHVTTGCCLPGWAIS